MPLVSRYRSGLQSYRVETQFLITGLSDEILGTLGLAAATRVWLVRIGDFQFLPGGEPSLLTLKQISANVEVKHGGCACGQTNGA